MSIRLNKLLAQRGLGARRKCDAMVAEGRVRVNGRVVNEPGTLVEEGRDRVEVDGRPLPGAQQHAYFVLNKPVGVITTLDDPQGRRTIAELLPRGRRLFPVGRLDADTSGLLLLTNDGELAHRLMHPRYGVEKFYRVRLEREPGSRQLERLAHGVEFEPGVVSAPARVRRIDPGFEAIMIEIAIHEGRFRQVRRMCEAVGLVVTGLHRVGYGPVRLGPLARGMWRELSEAEVARLRAASARPRRRGAPAAPVPGPARPARAERPTPPRERARTRDEEIEDTWVPGGGPLRETEDDAREEWPARGSRPRGDAAFIESGRQPARRDAGLPWHGPEYRRGTAASGERRRRERTVPGQRRDEAPLERERRPRQRGPGAGDFRPAPRREREPRGRESGRAADPRGERTREFARPAGIRSRPDRTRPRPDEGRRAGPPRGEDRLRGRRDDRLRTGPPRGGDRLRGRRDDRLRTGPPRGEDRLRGRRDDRLRTGPPRGENRLRGRRDERPRAGAPGRTQARRGGEARAFSPRGGRGPGPERARQGRGAPQRAPGGRQRRPEGRQRRSRNS